MVDELLVCHRCHNKSRQHIEESAFEVHKDVEIHDGIVEDVQVGFYLTRCATCDLISLYTEHGFGEPPQDSLYEARLIYPHVKHLSSFVPQDIRATYNEALKVRKISPQSFMLLMRRALELLCLDQKAKGRSLLDKIEDLVERDVLPKTLSSAANAIRFLGNDSAHESKIDVVDYHVSLIDDLYSALIEHLYVAPGKLDELRKSLSASRKKGRS